MATMNGVRSTPPRLDHASPVPVSSPAKRKRTDSIEAGQPPTKQESMDTATPQDAPKKKVLELNGVMRGITETNPAAVATVEDDDDSKTVLTLFGSAPQPRQLFTSFPKPSKTSSASRSTSGSDATAKDGATTQTPLREVNLPNGITTTKLLSVDLVDEPAEKMKKKRRGPTLGEVFPAPATLAQLQPPRPAKHTTTRGPTVDWYKAPASEFPGGLNRKGTYPTQPLTTGKSLSYNVAPPAPLPPSPDAKRLGRERTPSSGETKPALSEEVLAAHRAAQDEALFRSAFSGFAPTHDDSAAIVPEEVKNRIWWDRVGRSRYERLVEPRLFPERAVRDEGEEDGMMDVDGTVVKPEDDEIARDAIESWVPEELPSDLKTVDASQAGADEKEVEEVLADVSGLLETISAYQRVRHLNFTAPTSRPSSAHGKPSLTTVTGTPSTPSSAELMMYETLKSQLSLLISTLPPYAVAKLDGDRLAELNVTTLIPLIVKDFKGVMEPDEVAGAVKPKVPTAAPQARAGPYSTPQPNRPHHPAGAPVPRTAPHGPPPPVYYPPQPPSLQQSPGKPAPRGPPRAPQPPPGVAYGPIGYNQQTPRPNQAGAGPYGPTNPGQYFQQPAYNYPIQYQGAHPPRPTGTPPGQSPYQRPSQPAYQQHAQQRQQQQQQLYPPQAYPPGPPGPRSTSPQKPPSPYAPNPLQPGPPMHQRGGAYASPHPAPAMPHGPRQYFQSPSPNPPHASVHAPPPNPYPHGAPLHPHPQHAQQHPPLAQSPYPPTAGPPPAVNPGAGAQPAGLGASGFHTFMTAEQQALMMERQRAQLAAGAAASAQGSPAPQANQRAVAANSALPPNPMPGAAVGPGSVNGMRPGATTPQPAEQGKSPHGPAAATATTT